MKWIKVKNCALGQPVIVGEDTGILLHKPYCEQLSNSLPNIKIVRYSRYGFSAFCKEFPRCSSCRKSFERD